MLPSCRIAGLCFKIQSGGKYQKTRLKFFCNSVPREKTVTLFYSCVKGQWDWIHVKCVSHNCYKFCKTDFLGSKQQEVSVKMLYYNDQIIKTLLGSNSPVLRQHQSAEGTKPQQPE